MGRSYSRRVGFAVGGVALVGIMTVVVAGCGARSVGGGGSPLFKKTLAGQNKCDPKNDERPFIIDWDATDQSSFQARAASDIIVVRYSGCELKVLDGCANDSVKGALGAYRPVDWTAGQLEAIDMADEDDLYAKLPLGTASLGGRVQRGERFHMEYYVSGTRTATRSAVYRTDLDRISGCKNATHFVYAFNLGAFALASTSSLQTRAGGSYFGFGTGTASSSTTKADKRGGDLARCQGTSAAEVDQCRVPIRLALRPVTEGSSPDVSAARAEETASSLNLAGKLSAESDRAKEARQRASTAREKQISGDGSGCLSELDRHDQLDTTESNLSTTPKNGDLAQLRARCLMLSGRCDAGRQLQRNVLDSQGAANIDGKLDATIGEFCRGTNASLRDQFLRAAWVLQMGSAGAARLDAGECVRAHDVTRQLEGLPDVPFRSPDGYKGDEIRCVARTDCGKAWALFDQADAYLPDEPVLVRELLDAIRAHDKTAIQVARQKLRAVPPQLRASHRVGAQAFRSAVKGIACEPPPGADTAASLRTSPKPPWVAFPRQGTPAKQYNACLGDCLDDYWQKNNCNTQLPLDLGTGLHNPQELACRTRRVTCLNDCRSAYCTMPGDSDCPQRAATIHDPR